METPRPRPLLGGGLLKNLFSDVPVHGLGRERFTTEQKSDVEALFSDIGFATTDDFIMAALPGYLVMDMIDFVKLPPGSEEKKALAKEIKSNLQGVIDSIE
jgi:hypothetical protein